MSRSVHLRLRLVTASELRQRRRPPVLSVTAATIASTAELRPFVHATTLLHAAASPVRRARAKMNHHNVP